MRPYVNPQMLRQILMLMALLSGLSALCAPEQALAHDHGTSQVEAGEAPGGEQELASFAEIFGPVPTIAGAAKTPVAIVAIESLDAPRVVIGVDRSRQ